MFGFTLIWQFKISFFFNTTIKISNFFILSHLISNFVIIWQILKCLYPSFPPTGDPRRHPRTAGPPWAGRIQFWYTLLVTNPRLCTAGRHSSAVSLWLSAGEINHVTFLCLWTLLGDPPKPPSLHPGKQCPALRAPSGSRDQLRKGSELFSWTFAGPRGTQVEALWIIPLLVFGCIARWFCWEYLPKKCDFWRKLRIIFSILLKN